MIRTYLHQCSANQNKKIKIEAILVPYRIFAEKVAVWQWRLLQEGGNFYKDTSIKHLPSVLSARYKQTIQYQVVGSLKSYLENRKNDFVSMVRGSTLSEDSKIELFFINKHSKWFTPSVLMQGRSIPCSTLKLARRIFKQLLKQNRKPSFKHCNMVLDAKVAVIEKSNNSSYPYWLKLSTLESRQVIYIPLQKNPYFEEQIGVDKKSVQLNFDVDNHLKFIGLVKDIPDAKGTYKSKVGALGIDLGLCTFVATDQGDLMGRGWLDHLSKYDKIITELVKNLQKQGFTLRDSRKYRALVRKVRSWLENEVNRIMNRLIKIHKPAEIVVERLNFQNSNLSRRVNRIISKFGKGLFKAKLASLTETFGILITEINPAYTSQECVCGYVDKRNRLRQAIFKGKVCKTECNADIKAGKVVLRRSKDTKLSYLYIRRVELLDVLVSRFMDKLRIERKVFTHLCHNSLAKVLTSNPYFKRFRSEIKEIYRKV